MLCDPLMLFARRVQPRPGVGVEPVEGESLGLAGVLHARLLEVIQNHGGEVLLLVAFLLADRAVLILVGGGQYAMRRQTLHQERAAHPIAAPQLNQEC